MREASTTTSKFLESLKPWLEEAARPRPGEPSDISTQRSQAADSFLHQGLPDRTWESWRNSDPSFLWESDLPLDATVSFETVSVPRGVEIQDPDSTAFHDEGTPGSLLLEGRPLEALQAALSANRLLVRVPKGLCPAEPLVIRHRLPDRPMLQLPTLLLRVEEGARLQVRLEHVGGAPGSWSLPVLRGFIGKDATVIWTESHDQDPEAVQILVHEMRLRERAVFEENILLRGGRWIRHDLRVLLQGLGARATLKGLTLARGGQHIDLHTFVDHAVPDASSEQVFKGLVGGKATLVYNGQVLVREGASGTDARQVNRNLVLTDEALVFSQPRLEIYNDDVRCTHGSATGPLEEGLVFYLCSRGIGETEARRMLMEAFVGEVLGTAEAADLRGRVTRWMDAKEDGQEVSHG